MPSHKSSKPILFRCNECGDTCLYESDSKCYDRHAPGKKGCHNKKCIDRKPSSKEHSSHHESRSRESSRRTASSSSRDPYVEYPSDDERPRARRSSHRHSTSGPRIVTVEPEHYPRVSVGARYRQEAPRAEEYYPDEDELQKDRLRARQNRYGGERSMPSSDYYPEYAPPHPSSYSPYSGYSQSYATPPPPPMSGYGYVPRPRERYEEDERYERHESEYYGQPRPRDPPPTRTAKKAPVEEKVTYHYVETVDFDDLPDDEKAKVKK